VVAESLDEDVSSAGTVIVLLASTKPGESGKDDCLICCAWTTLKTELETSRRQTK
jgi:hypothetical protein